MKRFIRGPLRAWSLGIWSHAISMLQSVTVAKKLLYTQQHTRNSICDIKMSKSDIVMFI